MKTETKADTKWLVGTIAVPALTSAGLFAWMASGIMSMFEVNPGAFVTYTVIVLLLGGMVGTTVSSLLGYRDARLKKLEWQIEKERSDAEEKLRQQQIASDVDAKFHSFTKSELAILKSLFDAETAVHFSNSLDPSLDHLCEMGVIVSVGYIPGDGANYVLADGSRKLIYQHRELFMRCCSEK